MKNSQILIPFQGNTYKKTGKPMENSRFWMIFHENREIF